MILPAAAGILGGTIEDGGGATAAAENHQALNNINLELLSVETFNLNTEKHLETQICAHCYKGSV